MTRTQLEELIVRLEKATEPDRLLDAKIEQWRLGGIGVVSDQNDAVAVGWICGHGPQPFKAPEYTRSVDAALTLVPEGAIIQLRSVPAKRPGEGFSE